MITSDDDHAAERLPEHQHLRATLGRHPAQPLPDAEQQQPELAAAERELLDRQERREPAVLDAGRGDVAAGEQLGGLDHGLVDPPGPGRGDQQQPASVVRAGALQLLGSASGQRAGTGQSWLRPP
jgi:hypothetical protein